MFLSLLLTALLAAQPSSGASLNQAEAAELARNGQYEQALDAFRRIAAANPRDHQARLWIGRLHLWMGHPSLAEPVYRSVLLESPQNIDAMIGLGRALAGLHRTDDALEVLKKAEEAAPDNPEVLSALGQTYRTAGHGTRSLRYYQRAVAAAPTPENVESLHDTRFTEGHRVESNSFFESFNAPLPDTRASDITVNVRMANRLRLFGRGQVQRKFSHTEGRGGLGLEWRWRPETTLLGHAFVGPGNNVLPEVDANLEVDHRYDTAEWMLGYRFIQVGGAEVSVVSPAVTWAYSERLSLGLRYSVSITNLGGNREPNHSGTLNGAYRVHPRAWVSLAYARNNESFDTLSVDRVGGFHADTASGGLRYELPSLTSLSGTYEYQWRRGGIEMSRVRISIAQRF